MIYPVGKSVYQNLNTSFTNLEELLLRLKEERHTGYVHLRYWDYDAAIFVDSGKLINAIEERGEKRKIGADAVTGILEKGKEKDGVINVHSLEPDLVTLLASAADGEMVYRDLTTDFSSLDGLIEKLEGDKHTGFVEVVLKNGAGVGAVFLQDGDPVASILSQNGESYSGLNILPKIIEKVALHGAKFNVYRADLTKAIVDGAEMMAGFEMPRLLALWGEIIASAERVTEESSEQGLFLKTFKEACILHAEEYPYLDPFAAEFKYEAGSIEVKNASVRQLNEGLAKCLLATLETLDSKVAEMDILASAREDLTSIEEIHAEAIEEFKLGSFLPGLFT